MPELPTPDPDDAAADSATVAGRLHAFDPGVPVPPTSPVLIRRRGDRIRRRGTALVGAALVMVVAAVVLPIVVLASGRDSSTPAPPAAGDPAGAFAAPADSLLTPADLPEPGDGESDYRAWDLSPDRFPILGCHAGPVPDLGAVARAEVRYGTVHDDPAVDPATSPSMARAAEVVLDFDGADGARGAFDTVSGWIRECGPVGWGRTLGEVPAAPESVPVAGGTAILAARQIYDLDICDWRDGCDGWFLEHQGVAVVGARVVVVSWVEVGGNLTDEDALGARASAVFDTALTKATAPAESD